MKINGTRFGDIEFDASNTMTFPEGLIGFEDLREFLVMPDRVESTLFWIQSVENSSVAFLLTDPHDFFLDYSVSPNKGEQGKLQIESSDDCHALAVISVHEDQSITLNLAAPIIYAPDSKRALQVILEGAPYNTRTPLPTL